MLRVINTAWQISNQFWYQSEFAILVQNNRYFKLRLCWAETGTGERKQPQRLGWVSGFRSRCRRTSTRADFFRGLHYSHDFDDNRSWQFKYSIARRRRWHGSRRHPCPTTKCKTKHLCPVLICRKENRRSKWKGFIFLFNCLANLNIL